MKYMGTLGLAVSVTLCAGASMAQDEATTYVFGEYYVCDQNREAFADALAERAFGPIFDKHVEEGALTGWGWLSHNAGGWWRRVNYYTASDLNTLFDTRGKIIEEIQASAPDAAREFKSICPEHDDLVWESVAGTPAPQQLTAGPKASYSTYYICDVTKQERADEIIKQVYTPVINKLVESGELKSWGWYAHVIGGRYRRLMTHRGVDHKSLLAAVNKYGAAAAEANEALATEFGQICNSHVDYLWDVVLPKPEGN